MSVLNLNYDRRYDILYARLAEYSPSYGDEEAGIVTYYSIETDAITGMAIYEAKRKILSGDLLGTELPIPIDLHAVALHKLLERPELGHRCTLQLA